MSLFTAGATPVGIFALLALRAGMASTVNEPDAATEPTLFESLSTATGGLILETGVRLNVAYLMNMEGK